MIARSTSPQLARYRAADLRIGDDDHRALDAGELTNERQDRGADRVLVVAGRVVDREPVRVRRRQRGEIGGHRLRAHGVGRELCEATVVRAALGEQLDDPLPRIWNRQQRTLDRRRIVGDPVDDLIGRGDQTEHPPVAAQVGDVLRVEHHATAGRDHQTHAIGQFGGELALDAPEGLLPHRPEDVGNLAVAFFDDHIGVDELVPELLGEQAADGGLAGAHEAGEHDVARVRSSHGPTSKARHVATASGGVGVRV